MPNLRVEKTQSVKQRKPTKSVSKERMCRMSQKGQEINGWKIVHRINNGEAEAEPNCHR